MGGEAQKINDNQFSIDFTIGYIDPTIGVLFAEPDYEGYAVALQNAEKVDLSNAEGVWFFKSLQFGNELSDVSIFAFDKFDKSNIYYDYNLYLQKVYTESENDFSEYFTASESNILTAINYDRRFTPVYFSPTNVDSPEDWQGFVIVATGVGDTFKENYYCPGTPDVAPNVMALASNMDYLKLTYTLSYGRLNSDGTINFTGDITLYLTYSSLEPGEVPVATLDASTPEIFQITEFTQQSDGSFLLKLNGPSS